MYVACHIVGIMVSYEFGFDIYLFSCVISFRLCVFLVHYARQYEFGLDMSISRGNIFQFVRISRVLCASAQIYFVSFHFFLFSSQGLSSCIWAVE